MGMYDYLGGEQVKIFYSPIFYKSGKEMYGSSIYHSGGMLRNFKNNEILPLKTLYYKYPKNFIVYDYQAPNDNIRIVKKGRFHKSVKPRNIGSYYNHEAVYDYYGQKLNINTTEDFKNIVDDSAKLDADKANVDKKYFGERNFMDVIKEDEKYFDSIQDKYYADMDNLTKQFRDKWFINEYEEEKLFGEFLDCYMFLKRFKSVEKSILDVNDSQQEYLDCKAEFKKYIQEHKGIIKKYRTWYGPSNLDATFPKLIQEIMIEDEQNKKGDKA